jgi:4-amino-4-deoxy-L-arabinose transferase-like glycosyltransferase
MNQDRLPSAVVASMLSHMLGPNSNRSLVPLAVVAGAKLGLHLATYRGYGLFRDEFYYLASTDHLGWGYVEHPPLSIAVLAASRAVFGDSLFATRLWVALAGAATVFIAGLIVREAGGGRRAEIVAAVAVLIMPTYLAMGHFYSMNGFDILFWALLSWLAVRALARDEGRTWLVFGLVAGLGLMNKISVGFLAFGLVVGLVLTRQRRQLLRPELWMGGAIALLIFLPHLIWQAQNDWPTLEFQANARAGKNLSLSAFEFASEQVLMSNPFTLPLWLAGLGALLFMRRFAQFRPLGFVYPLLFTLFVLTAGKAYYLTPIYTLLFAFGAVVIEPVLEWRRWVTPALVVLFVVAGVAIMPIAMPVLSPETYLAYTRTIGITQPALENQEQGALPQLFADMHGWQELVEAVDRAAESLTPEERGRAVVLATNYGEAGALDIYGPARDLPPAVSGHNSYWLWRPARLDGPVITLRRSREELEPWFEHIERVDTVQCEWCMPYQNNAPVHIARGLKVPPEEFWRHLKRFQ